MSGHAEFRERIRRLLKKHREMAHGYAAVMGPDGLVEFRPRRASSNSASPRYFAIFLGAFVLFKGTLLAELGPETYDQRVDVLNTGNVIAQAGALAMRVDPLSEIVSGQIRRVFH
ncbi:hypothetical protein [Phaeobacter sp. 22II1-1F12B]|uniref:hypothetical protein n=1 Tax=Phaeobacter sp. 22II1-1F12B TaxID=1317111 RepID=UPI000B62AD35|nr:hypothetical protein [Phaeobacter sp. 22II1-1F12B]OWU76255.1 hypothetical protein ATO1_16450 [Phaeobacter sp. 22II1-1F12B]